MITTLPGTMPAWLQTHLLPLGFRVWGRGFKSVLPSWVLTNSVACREDFFQLFHSIICISMKSQNVAHPAFYSIPALPLAWCFVDKCMSASNRLLALLSRDLPPRNTKDWLYRAPLEDTEAEWLGAQWNYKHLYRFKWIQVLHWNFFGSTWSSAD